MPNTFIRSALALTLALSFPASGADIYRCRGPQGEPLFSDDPCPGGRVVGDSRDLAAANRVQALRTESSENEAESTPRRRNGVSSGTVRRELERLERARRLAGSGAARSFYSRELKRVSNGLLDRLSWDDRQLRENALRFIGGRHNGHHRLGESREAEWIEKLERRYGALGVR